MEPGKQRKSVSVPRMIWRMGGLWVLFPLVFAVTFGGIGIHALHEARLVDRYGVEGFAVITDRETRTRRDSEGRTQTSYHLSYRFEMEGRASGDIWQEGSQSVSQRFYNRHRVGDRVPVVYVPHDPRRSQVEPGRDLILGAVFGGVGAMSLLLTLGLGWWMWQRKLSAIRALQHGEMRQARVTGHSMTSLRVNDQPRYAVDWIDATGARGRTGPLSPKRLALAPIGSTIVIYVDPETDRGWWEEEV